MVTLELPQARRLAGSVVLGQVVITVLAAILCFAVWGRNAGLSALVDKVGGGVMGVIAGVFAVGRGQNGKAGSLERRLGIAHQRGAFAQKLQRARAGGDRHRRPAESADDRGEHRATGSGGG